MKLKTLVAASLASFMAMGLASAKLQVMTSFTVLQDIASNIAGQYADVKSLTAIGAEIHEYEPTPKDLVALNKSDLLIINGSNLEQWFKRFYENSGSKVPVYVASRGVVPDYIPSGPYEGKANPHTWMSIKNAYIYVANVLDALSTADPANAKNYEKNALEYIAKLDKVRTDVEGFVRENKANFKNLYLITSESAFSYVARDLHIDYDSLWPVNAEDEGTPQQINRIIKVIKDKQVPVVFSGSTMDDKPMKTVCKETGAKFGGYLYVDTLTDKDGPIPTYLDMLSKTVYTIVDGYKAVLKK